MASFQANIGRKRPRRRENRNSRYIPFLHDNKLKIAKKLQKYHYDFISSENRLEKAEKKKK